jgi:hypothetical protein
MISLGDAASGLRLALQKANPKDWITFERVKSSFADSHQIPVDQLPGVLHEALAGFDATTRASGLYEAFVASLSNRPKDQFRDAVAAGLLNAADLARVLPANGHEAKTVVIEQAGGKAEFMVGPRLFTGWRPSTHLGWDAGKQQRVALQVLNPGMEPDYDKIDMLLRDRKDQTLPRSFGVGTTVEAEPARCLVLEYCEGDTLTKWLETVGHVETVEAVRIAMQMLRGLSEIHAKGYRHNDIAPYNMHLQDGKSSTVKLLTSGRLRRSPATGRIRTTPTARPSSTAHRRFPWRVRSPRTSLKSVGC